MATAQRTTEDAVAWDLVEVRGLHRSDAQPMADLAGPWRRMPDTHESLIHPALVERARQLSGVRLAVATDSPWLGGVIDSEPGASVSLTGTETPQSVALDDNGRFRFDGLGDDWKTLELWLPHRVKSRFQQLVIGGGATVARPAAAGGRWVCYGSSISQGIHSSAPHLTWPALAALRTGLDLRLLGFASEAHADPVVAADIRDGAASLITICLGINTHTSGSASLRVFWSDLSGFVETVRERHKDTPMVLMSPVASPSREMTPSSPRFLPRGLRGVARQFGGERLAGTLGPTLSELREVVHEIGARVNAESPGQITVIDGRDLLGDGDAELLVDGLHPGDRGAQLIANRFVELLPPDALARRSSNPPV